MVFIGIPFGSSNRIIIIQFRCLTIYSLLIYDRLYRKTKKECSPSKNCYERKKCLVYLLTVIHLHLNCWVSPVTQIRWSLLAEKDKFILLHFSQTFSLKERIFKNIHKTLDSLKNLNYYKTNVTNNFINQTLSPKT